MNHLLKTLSDSKVKALPDVDLKSLLSTVRDGRGRKDENALSNAFYDSLEGVLADLRTVTLDNHDAEAFLKPVLKAEVPTYSDVISNPMDFQTMGKKLKSRSYKSKKEFKDDLDLIWANCIQFNTEHHGISKAAMRLKAKAEKLLANVTDRRERLDPHLPNDLSTLGAIKINGINGRAHTRTPSASKTPTLSTKSSSIAKAVKIARRSGAFEESPALVRTPEGMVKFREMDQSLQAGPSSAVGTRMRELLSEHEDDYDSESASLGDKRKVVNGINDSRAHKRARFATPLPVSDSSPNSPTTASPTDDELTQLWWTTVQSDAMLPNGLPEIPFPSSIPSHPFLKPPIPNSKSATAKKKKRRKKLPDSYRPEDKPKALLTLMNSNIRTIKRVRHTHARFAALGLAKDTGAGNEDGDNETAATAYNAPGSAAAGSGSGSGLGLGPGAGGDAMDVEEATDDRVDERPWEVPTRGGRKLSGIEMGDEYADDCVRWMNGKVLEHAGFQGTSKATLDVLSGVTSEYLLNVGRSIKFLVDKFAHTMSPEEIILHTLFESGISEIQDLERYVADDVERYGSRLADIEKKLVGAYREITSVDSVEDEGLFDEEEEDETSALALGEFADVLGVDYFGLRELGIADEFGMQSLTIPKRLLKGKKKRENLPAVAKPTEPPPPFPPPPPFLPLTAGQIPEQIGLLQKYYQERIPLLPPSIPSTQTIYPLAPPSLPGPSLGNPYPIPSLPKPTIPSLRGPSGTLPTPSSLSQTSTLSASPSSNSTSIPSSSLASSSSQTLVAGHPPSPPPPPPDTIIPDDSPQPNQVKMGPLGQIVKTGSSYPAAKKKTKAAAAAAAAAATASTANNINASPGKAYPASMSNPPSADLNGVGMMNGIVTPGPGSATGAMELSAGVGDPSGVLPHAGFPGGVNGVGVGPATTPKKKKGATGIGSGNGGKKKAAQAQAQNGQHGQQDPRPPPFPPVVAASA
ncbi:hypothetical protein GYMLUDRAFT_586847 [Collybiopsis luxurians FD-317 M1]|uniref:Bromo domain-containing protein n=1 Tax=Collybiopsis luxurians FD-317 M1 TaxID=944289 RepID=A0A0D0CEQ3_9AGAR|nr:hypothetical protein GYMLUDRAFT_586847 [Collybiopsis luxurians FD-317 M1]